MPTPAPPVRSVVPTLELLPCSYTQCCAPNNQSNYKCIGLTFLTFSFSSTLCVRDYSQTCGKLILVTRNGPALLVMILLLLGRVTIANLPGLSWAVTVSGGRTLASRLRYAAWAAVVARVMVSS